MFSLTSKGAQTHFNRPVQCERPDQHRESVCTLGLDAASYLYIVTDLSIIQGKEDITVNPNTAGRGTLYWSYIALNGQPDAGHHRNGAMTFTGSSSNIGVGSSICKT